MKRFYTILSVSVLLLFGGCQPSKRPDGLPPLYPCTVTITQNGTPAADVSVRFISKETSKWPVTGITDASGKAVMVTYGQFKGAPLGEYTVVVSKTESESVTAASEYSSGITKIFSLIAVEHRQPETSQLQMTVQKGNNTETFDVGKPVRVLVDMIRPGT